MVQFKRQSLIKLVSLREEWTTGSCEENTTYNTFEMWMAFNLFPSLLSGSHYCGTFGLIQIKSREHSWRPTVTLHNSVRLSQPLMIPRDSQTPPSLRPKRVSGLTKIFETPPMRDSRSMVWILRWKKIEYLYHCHEVHSTEKYCIKSPVIDSYHKRWRRDWKFSIKVCADWPVN